MDWISIIKSIGIFTAGSVSIAGIVIYFSKKIFENQLSILHNEHLHRFSKLYTEKLDIIRETYRRLVIAEKSLEFLMRPIKFSNVKPKEDIENETMNSINALFDYFDENEIVFDESIAALMIQLRERFYKAWGVNDRANFMEQARGTDAWKKSIEEKIDVYNKVITIEIPELKNRLRSDFQKRYKIFEIN